MQMLFASRPSALALCRLSELRACLPSFEKKLSRLVPYALAIIIMCSCASAPTPGPVPTPGGELSGGLLATFEVDGEIFHVWVTNPKTIDDLKALASDTNKASVPTGPILPGSGSGDHNAPWSWHFDPVEMEMAEKASKECDQRPSYLEQNLQELLEMVGRYCPSGAALLDITEYP